MKAPCYLSYTAFKENSVTSNKSISLLNFFLNSTLDLENFAMHSISIAAACCQLSSTKVHGRSYRDKLDRRRSAKFTMGNESAPIQLAQCRFPRLAISNAKILTYFSNKIYRRNFIKQHSKTVMVRNYQNADCSCVIYYNFPHAFVPYTRDG